MAAEQSRAAAGRSIGWHWYDWTKLAVVGLLAASLIPLGGQPSAPAAVATAAPVATAAVAPTVVATVAPAGAATAAAPVAIAVPQIEAPAGPVAAGRVLLQGTGTPGSTVEILVDGAAVGTAVVGPDGRWQLETELAAGERVLGARALDAGGQPVADAEPLSIVAEAAPAAIAAPLIEAPVGAVAAGRVLLQGTGTPGSTVEILVDGAAVGTTVVGPDGRWQLETELAAGERVLGARALDAGGQPVADAEPLAIVAEAAPAATTAPVAGGAITIGVPTEGATLPAGRVEVSGAGPAGAQLEILNSDQVLAETTVGADGTWRAEVELPDGTASISVREKGAADIAGRPVRVVVGSGQVETCTTLAVGCQAWVTRTGGLVLRMRSGPTTAGDNIIARLPIGTQMELLEGPQPADGFNWWRVRTLGGEGGWVAGENLVLQPD